VRNILFISLSLLLTLSVYSQEDTPVQEQLEEVVISSQRIAIPFSEDSRTITIITSEEIQKSAAFSVADLLQQVAGVDIRRRGTAGMQADLYIRGGGFDQTLLLIDGIKVEDAQTGHHTLNMALPLEVIERIEIIKGPAARVYGQNAFTGAVNIITKKDPVNAVNLGLSGGSYQQLNGEVTVASNFEHSSHLVHFSRNTSEGYRYNTDYDNTNYFLKSIFNSNKQPIEMIGSFSERKFGANGFYASPAAKDQYEETQTSLVGATTTFRGQKFNYSPRIYWRRNQDEYVFVRQDPSIYRNLHTTNKVGAEVNANYNSELGITGFGIDLSQVYLSSNNLGQRDRFMGTLFLEHRFEFFKEQLDVTPGVAATYFSDFDIHFFPGIDVGYSLSNQWKLYANAGYTYRIPTYTDLYYSDPTTLGNEDLDPEEALAQEIGLRYNTPHISVTLAGFNRDSENLIDYVKENEEDIWRATNIRSLNTKGLEAQFEYRFEAVGFPQLLRLGYNFIEDEVKELDINFSRYSINSLKHQFVGTLQSQILKNVSQTIVYRYAERTAGESYSVVDIALSWNLKEFELSLIANNIFNEDYSETNLVPMPKGNVLFGVNYRLK
jgi:vitamin B12 transporter